jgi:hypothetical protein
VISSFKFEIAEGRGCSTQRSKRSLSSIVHSSQLKQEAASNRGLFAFGGVEGYYLLRLLVALASGGKYKPIFQSRVSCQL